MGLGIGAATLAAAGIGAVSGIGSSIASNVMNKMSVIDTNRTNMNIAQMNNEFNERMLEKQMAYNSPANQKRLKQEAGINPYIDQSTLGSITTPTATPVTAQPAQYDFSGISQSIMSGLSLYSQLKQNNVQTDLLKQEVLGKQQENYFKSRKLMAELANTIAETKNKEAQTKSLDTFRDIERQQRIASVDNTLQQTANLKETIKGIVIQNSMDALTLKNMPQQIKLQMANVAASTAFMVAQKAMSEKQAIHEIAKTYLTQQQGKSAAANNKYAYEMAQNLYEQAKLTLEQLENNTGSSNIWQILQNPKGGRKPIIGSGKNGVYYPGHLF